MSNQTEWRWADPAGQQRLVREDELRAALAKGVIPANAPVWTRGWSQWKAAHDVPELVEDAKLQANDDVPPPPQFIVAAQNAFEGKKPVVTGPAEPPVPPPRYVPIAPTTVPAALGSDTKIDLPKAPPPPPKHTPAPMNATTLVSPVNKPQTKPPALPPSKAPPPLPVAARKISGSMGAVKPRSPQQTFTKTERPPMGVAPPSEAMPPSGGRHTLHIAPAPPPMPRLDVLPIEPSQRVTVPADAAPTLMPSREALAALRDAPKEPSSKFPTLMMFGGDESAPATTQALSKKPASDEARPIVVPPPEPSIGTNAVTRPPPWGEGAVEMSNQIPKSPRMPSTASVEDRPSEAPRPMELSSSDLTSEAHIDVVKATPLAPAERPRTMASLGPAADASEARASMAQAPKPAPLPPSDIAGLHEVPRAPPPKAPDKNAFDVVIVKAREGYANLRERTKDKPPWFLPAIGGGGALVVLILFVAMVKAAIGSSDTPIASASTTSSGSVPTSTGSIATSAHTGILPVPTGPARPMTCQASGPARTVAPKAVISSGVEVTGFGNQVALGFAIAPKEAALEIIDATNVASANALHLRSNDPVRRVLALDTSKAAVDVDHKGDKLQGRRTFRANPPIDLGASEGGLVWAPHGTDKGIKLWSLANADAPVEALRGEPIPSGGFAVAFRQSGAIWFGAFGGSPPAPLAGLAHIDGLGPQIGSPAIAVSGNRVMIAWADRASATDTWSIRYATFKPGDDASQAKSFAVPPGGLGEHAMSPGLAALGDSRFLLVWTEGPVSSHQVRAAVLSDGAAGAPFTVSADGVNAGQGQAAVLADGHGVVAFLAKGAGGFEVSALPIQCVEK